MRASRLGVVGVSAVVCVFIGCSKDYRRIVEKSPDGQKAIIISHSSAWGCGSDGCVVVTLIDQKGKTELYRRSGFFSCFAMAAWTIDSQRVSVVAQNCYGATFATSVDSTTYQQSPIGSDLELLKSEIRVRHGIDVEGDLRDWVRTQAAIQIYADRLLAESKVQ